ncbi:MAG: FGGY-family carbohydrate kinase [Myxococcota bacterium]|jgi:xylulokinase|nr:FGGY-family carbohydrate kinase [Myxococcota bacterium]
MMETKELILSIDLGTTAVKAALVNRSGQVVASGSTPLHLMQSDDGGAQQDGFALWAAVLNSCQQALSDAQHRSAVFALAVGAQYSSIIPVDKNHEPLMPMVMWLDQRGSIEGFKKLGQRFNDHPLRQLRWLQIHGIPPLPSGADSLSHMRYIKVAKPEIYAKTVNFLEPMDYVCARLSGRAVANRCSAFMMLLTDNRRDAELSYDDTLVRYSQIDRGKLPELVSLSEPIGKILPEIAKELGLSADTLVLPGINDTQAGGMGTGAFSGSHGGISIGTSSVLVTHADFKRTSVRYSLATMPSPVDNKNFVMAECGVGGKALEHFLEGLVFADDAFGCAQTPDPFVALHQAIAKVEPGANGLLYFPWLNGSMSPAEDGKVRGGFLNMSLDTSRAALGRAVLEGVANNIRWVSQAVEKFTGRHFSHQVFYGGGAMSAAWAQILADVLQVPVHQAENPRYVPCIGAAFFAFYRLGLMSLEECAEAVNIRQVFTPRTEYSQRYNANFTHFVEGFRRNRKIFHGLNAS